MIIKYSLYTRRIARILILFAIFFITFDTISHACDIFDKTGKRTAAPSRSVSTTVHRTAAEAEADVVTHLAASMHDTSWRPGFLEENGSKAHQPKPIDESWLPARLVRALRQFKRHPKVYTREDGTVVQSIALDSAHLIPQLNLKLNGKLAGAFARTVRQAIEARETTGEWGNGLLETLSAKFHIIYMEQNTWQLESIFQKITGDKNKAYGFDNITELLDYLAKLTEEQRSKLDAEEVDRLAQFRTYEELSEPQKDLDREKVRQTLDYFGDARSGNTRSAADVEAEVVAKLAAQMHDVSWYPPFRAENGPKAEQPKPLDPNWIPRRLYEVLTTGYGAKYREIYALPDGTIVQNINVPSQFLIPELNLKLNGKLAGAFANTIRIAIEEGREGERERLSDEFHIIYMEQNSWQLESVFQKLTGDKNNVYQFESLSGLLRYLADLTSEQRSKLDAEELDRVAQFRNYDELSDAQKDLDRAKVDEVIDVFRQHMGL